MKTFKFNVVQVDTYSKTFKIEGSSEHEAYLQLKEDLDEQSLDTLSNTFQDMETTISVKRGKNWETIND